MSFEVCKMSSRLFKFKIKISPKVLSTLHAEKKCLPTLILSRLDFESTYIVCFSPVFIYLVVFW